jgi:hypothetical protein
MVFVGLRSSGGYRVGFNNSNSNSNSNNNNVQRNNIISLEPLERNVYRINWNAGGRTHHLFLNPNSTAGLIARMHPGQGVSANTLNTILAATAPNTFILKHPTTRAQIRRNHVSKVRNPHHTSPARRSPSRSPARQSPARRSPSRSPARRSPARRSPSRSPARRSPSRSPARRRTVSNRARSAGLAAGRAGLAAGRLAGRALLAAARTGLAVGRGAGRMAVHAYRTSQQSQRNRNIARARRLAAGGSAY